MWLLSCEALLFHHTQSRGEKLALITGVMTVFSCACLGLMIKLCSHYSRSSDTLS